MDLICLLALPGVSCVVVAILTWDARRALRAFLLWEMLWLGASLGIIVAPVHGAEKGMWVNPVRNIRLVYDAVKNGRAYLEALQDTAPVMQRELEADSYECLAQWMDTKTKAVNEGMAEACMGARGWMRVSSAKQMADAYGRAWEAEVDRHDGIDPGIFDSSLFDAPRRRPFIVPRPDAFSDCTERAAGQCARCANSPQREHLLVARKAVWEFKC
jgi:hypothetical protein